MTEKIKQLFTSRLGRKIYSEIIDTVERENMAESFKNGVLVGFSGGADSVLLLSFLYRYREKTGYFPIVAVHVNHGIRGEEAERDMLFSREFAEKLGIEFLSFKLDIPKIAREGKTGIEEAARNERYKTFDAVLKSRDDIAKIAVAHNATDNAETVIFNMLRGSGLRGIAGIAPVRDNVIRPLIRIPKEDVVLLLTEGEVPFVTDSTNFSTEYSRNYIRHELLPRFKHLSPSPEASLLRLSAILRETVAYLDLEASEFVRKNFLDGQIAVSALKDLSPAIKSEALMQILTISGAKYESTHIVKICELLDKNAPFSYDIPGSLSFVSDRLSCRVTDKKSENGNLELVFSYPLALGINEFSGVDGAIIVSKSKLTDSYSNVYKIAIQQRLPFDIINNSLTVRSRLEGDSYRYAGMTHKIKKMFIDAKIPKHARSLVPIICDKAGILWPIGFSPRENSESDGENYVYIALAFRNEAKSNKSFYFKQNNNSKTKGS